MGRLVEKFELLLRYINMNMWALCELRKAFQSKRNRYAKEWKDCLKIKVRRVWSEDLQGCEKLRIRGAGSCAGMYSWTMEVKWVKC
jgi:hypothetical protein